MQVYATGNLISMSLSFFVWLFTDCMRRKLVIFIALCFLPLAMTMCYRAELLVNPKLELTIVEVGALLMGFSFPLLSIPLIPELAFNVKAYRKTFYDLKVNDFAAAVFFSFSSFASFLAEITFSEDYLQTFNDFLIMATIIFTICYACYIDVRSTCRKDKEEEEGIFQNSAENRPQAYKAYPEVQGADQMPF